MGETWFSRLETQARARIGCFDSSGDDDAQLLHELRVRGLELELQNSELLRYAAQVERLNDSHRSLLAAVPVGHLALDSTGRIRKVSPLGARLLGHEAGELSDRHLQAFLCRTDADALHIHLRELLASGVAQTLDVVVDAKDAGLSRVHLHIVLADDADESADPGCWVFMTDLSEQAEWHRHLAEQRCELAIRVAGGTVASGAESEGADATTITREMMSALREQLCDRIALVCEPRASRARAVASRHELERIVFHLCAFAQKAMLSAEQAVLRLGRTEYVSEEATEGADEGALLKLSLNGRTTSIESQALSPRRSALSDGQAEIAALADLADQCSGSIELRNHPHSGYQVDVYLPLLRDDEASEATTEPVVLLVDDDFSMLYAVMRLLRSNGYQVFAVTSAVDAISVAKRENQRLDLLLTDVRMLVVDGVQLGEQLAYLRPDLPRLYMSGDLGDAVVDAGAVLIPKPFTPDELLALVARCRITD